ncbi:MAG: hypothetical protein Q4D02_04765 [Clostridia bacterium]|nr:hypothetical protein [Clostridia bacterium]
MKNFVSVKEIFDMINIYSEEIMPRVTELECKITFIDTQEELKIQRKKIIGVFDDLKLLEKELNVKCEVELNVVYRLKDGENHIFRSVGFLMLENVGKEVFDEAVFNMSAEPSAIFANVYESLGEFDKELIKSYLIIGI